MAKIIINKRAGMKKAAKKKSTTKKSTTKKKGTNHVSNTSKTSTNRSTATPKRDKQKEIQPLASKPTAKKKAKRDTATTESTTKEQREVGSAQSRKRSIPKKTHSYTPLTRIQREAIRNRADNSFVYVEELGRYTTANEALDITYDKRGRKRTHSEKAAYVEKLRKQYADKETHTKKRPSKKRPSKKA